VQSSTAPSSEPMTLREEDLPAVYQAADQNSVEAQRRFLRRSATGLLMVLIAAGAGVFLDRFYIRNETVDFMGIVAAAAFIVAIFARISLFSDRPERIWYGGRAVAESAKTLAWRYSVGGAPFQVGQDPDEVDAAFIARLEDLLTDVNAASLAPPSGGGKQITQRMRELRVRPLDERKEAYRAGRIEDQLQWYSRKARWNKVRSDRWNFALLSIEAFGLLAAIATATSMLKDLLGWQIDVLGLTGAVVAAGASWLQTKQHSNLAEAYSVAAHELAAIDDRIPAQRTEENWARFVNESEDAISREHRLWRASRTMK
jgi:hypothetical protein